jgi:hypothetical protein
MKRCDEGSRQWHVATSDHRNRPGELAGENRGLPRAWNVRSQHRRLLVGKPEMMPTHRCPPFGGRESHQATQPEPFMGPYPSFDALHAASQTRGNAAHCHNEIVAAARNY